MEYVIAASVPGSCWTSFYIISQLVLWYNMNEVKITLGKILTFMLFNIWYGILMEISVALFYICCEGETQWQQLQTL